MGMIGWFNERAGCRVAFLVSLVGALAVNPSFAADGDAKWKGEVAVSATAQSGTTDSFVGGLDAKAERTSEADVVTLRLKGDYGTTKKTGGTSDRTQDSQALSADWKHTVHDRFFWETGSVLSRDSTQNRRMRAAVDTGPGYRVWRSDDGGAEHFDLMGGVGYRFEIYDEDPDTTSEDGTNSSHFADLVASFEYKNMLFDNKIDYTHTGSVRAPANSFSDYIVFSEAIVGVPLTEAWSFRASFSVEYVNEVPDGINKVTTKTSLGLGYTF